MLKYAKIINKETKECSVGTGDNIEFYKKIGFKKLDVSQGINNKWYITGHKEILDEDKVKESAKLELYSELDKLKDKMLHNESYAGTDSYQTYRDDITKQMLELRQKLK